MIEPLLNSEDHRIWKQLEKTMQNWSSNKYYKKRIELAKSRIKAELEINSNGIHVAWSGGKDSTVLTLLVTESCQELGIDNIPVMSQKDDLDFPGEEEYIKKIADEIEIDLTIIHPEISLTKYVFDNFGDVNPGDDIHKRTANLSKVGFYSVIEKYQKENNINTIFLGLRSEESFSRKINRISHGWKYKKKNGTIILQPICDLLDIDVYSYLFEKGIDFFHIYKCVRLHDSPFKIRKSWWIPGRSASKGQTIWLRTYYPSLFNKLTMIWPKSRILS